MSEETTPAPPTVTLPQAPPKGDPFRLGWRYVPRRDENGLVQVTQVPLSLEDVLHQRVVSHHFWFGSGDQARLSRSPHRYIWPSELDLMAQLAGFELEARHADWAGAEFTAESRSHVSVYRC